MKDFPGPNILSDKRKNKLWKYDSEIKYGDETYLNYFTIVPKNELAAFIAVDKDQAWLQLKNPTRRFKLTD